MINFEKYQKEYRQTLAEKMTREELLEVIEIQDPELIKGIQRIEWVFENKLRHLNWPTGEPISGKPLTNKELSLLVDVPFEYSEELASMGLNENQQREYFISADPVLWARKFLNATPRVYQIIILRNMGAFKVLRAGRRLGKSWTMAVALLWYSYITNNGRSLVVTPMRAQADLIYEECLRLAGQNNIVKDSIGRNVRNPNPEIAFKNGSTIRFFTSGMKSAGKSDVTRGQEAHFIVLDELDYMGEDDMDALLAMLQKTDENQPDKRLLAASTPSGRKAKLWEWSHSKRFQAFWYPSYCNPFWNLEQEEFFRDFYSEIGYRHEIEADWGEDADGVYPRKYVDAAFVSEEDSWEYKQPSVKYSKPGSFTVFGVDWDKYGAGTNIVVLEVFDQRHEDPALAGKIRLLYREETIREEYTLTKAVDKIIHLNNIFDPRHIYIDRGYGDTQYELLKRHGVENPHTGLVKKIKGISFASVIEMPDPYSGLKVKKEIKPFMIDTLRSFLERGTMLFSSKDEELYLQLISYIVSRITSSGRPVFEMSGSVADHCHDALILATLAIKENYDDLMFFKSTNYVSQITTNILDPLLDMVSNDSSSSRFEQKVDQDFEPVGNFPGKIRRTNISRRSNSSRRGVSRRMF
jgi:replicative DNA helicase